MRTIVLALLLTLGGIAQAENQTLSTAPVENYTKYYEIDEPKADLPASIVAPLDWMKPQGLAQAAVSLMRWALNRVNWPTPTENYDRLKHFGTWLRDRKGGSCLNTRGEVLAQASSVRPTLSPDGCRVVEGQWFDPYTAETHSKADEMQVDHMVPLKNAYVSGAWKWERRERCAYANFMADHFHLVAVSGHANMSKGDSTPAEWLPPNAGYVCEYLKSWLSVKLIWGLIMNPDETAAIKKAFLDSHCDARQFTFRADELAQQRAAIQSSLEKCKAVGI